MSTGNNVQLLLEQALEKNKQLQEDIQSKLAILRQKKACNRHQVARLITDQFLQPATSSSTAVAATTTTTTKQSLDRNYFTAKASDGQYADNIDTDTRKRLLQEYNHFITVHPNWSSSDCKRLVQIVKKQEDEDEDEISFTKVAREFNNATDSNNSNLTDLEYSAEACRIKYEQQIKPKVTFTVAMRQELVQLVDEYGDDITPCWIDIASTIASNNSGTISAWDCLQFYQTKVKPPSQKLPLWTIEQDQFIVRYIAAMGPQYVIDNSQLIHLAIHFFPDKSLAQLANRIHQSLLNPNLQHKPWTKHDDRKLCILMKVYSNNADIDVPALAALHFDDRSCKSVVEKWSRTLNPEYSTLPFSKAEDEQLLSVMRQHKVGWTELSQRFFPTRHPQRLMGRLVELDPAFDTGRLPSQQKEARPYKRKKVG